MQMLMNNLFTSCNEYMMIFVFTQVYDIDVENLPMFVYQLPPGTSNVLLTDRVIFTITHQEQSEEVIKLHIEW